ncbi:hypothetical protein ABE10_12300 [Bacillus toyonensis]|nr:hypothetical protein [Bacillus toyonensis]
MLGCLPPEEGACRIDEESLAQRLTPDEHAETHLAAVAEGHLGRQPAPAEHQVEEHDDPALSMAGGAAHVPAIEDRKLHRDQLVCALPWTDVEANPRIAIAFELMDMLRVQRGTASAGVDLGLDPGNPDIRQTDPLSPPDRGA